MRFWSIHPRYLDRKGLGANWREGLLAQAVLLGRTKGWRNHPQLKRVKEHPAPIAAIGFFLLKVHKEATRRGYNYNLSKLVEPAEDVQRAEITVGQLRYEAEIPMERLMRRAPRKYEELLEMAKEPGFPEPHPMFTVVDGNMEQWESGYWKSQTG